MKQNNAPILLSILTTTRSDSRLLSCIRSVESLSKLIHVEHVIQEAGTTSDECLEIIQSLSHCSYISEPDSGIYEGMNRCINRANGMYSLVLNSDDSLIEQSLSVFANHITSSKFDILLFDILLLVGNKTIPFSSLATARLGRIHIAYGMGYPHGGFVVKTSVLREHSFDYSYGLEADYAQMIHILGDKSLTRLWICFPIQYFTMGGASSRRPYFSGLNPHLSHLKILINAPILFPIRLAAILLRLIMLVAVFPKHLFCALTSLKLRFPCSK